jgi:hypothetical protein
MRMWVRGTAAIVPIGLVGFSYFLSNLALVVPERLRVKPQAQLADETAACCGARWIDAEIKGADGARQSGWFFEPREANGRAVIILHGHFDSRKGSSGFAPMFLRHGYAVLAPDDRGHGVSEGLSTYGALEVEDTRRWVEWIVARNPNVRVYGLGESMGAAILLQSLTVEPRIRAVAVEGAYTTFRRVAYDRMERWFDMPRSVAGLVAEPTLFYIRLRHGVDLGAANPIDILPNISTPILNIHGTGDRNVAPENSAELYRARPEGSEIWKPEGAGHTRAATLYPEEFERRVTGWFDTH